MTIQSRLLPLPRQITAGEGVAAFKPMNTGKQVEYAFGERNVRTLYQKYRKLVASGTPIRMVSDDTGAVRMGLGDPPDNVPAAVADQGYKLTISQDGITLTGWGDAGLYYGTRTLLQLLDHGTFPCCTIVDWPDYRYRMVHYDLAREQTCNMAYLKSVIDRLSEYKVNMMALYFENRFQFSKHPLISVPGVMAPAQAKELDAYARDRFVELVPQVNCLSHLEQALAVPEYRKYAEVPDDSWMVCPLNPDVPALLEDMIDEVSACFTSQYFHMGGDEAWQMGKCDKCAQWISDHEGGASALFARHFGMVHDMITKRGKKTMMWGDMLLAHPEAADMISKDIIVFDWHYDDTTPDTLKFFTSRGFPVFASPAMSGFGRTAAPFAHAQSNIWNFIGQGKDVGVLGECTCAWEVRMGHLFDNDMFGIILSADRSWNADACKLDEFNPRFCRVFYGIDDLRPVEYFRMVSDGFRAIEMKMSDYPASSSWWALSGNEKPIPDAIYEEALAHQQKCLELLDGIRRDATKHKETLAFADLPAHTSMLMINKSYLSAKAKAFADQGMTTDSRTALRQLLDELQYFEDRFQAAIKAFGGSIDDVQRIRYLEKQYRKRM